MKKALWVNFVGTANVGDRACSLTRYLKILGAPAGWTHENVNITSVNLDTAKRAKASVIIIGAGGLLMSTIHAFLGALLHSPPCPVVIWGIGSNYALDYVGPEYPDFLRKATQVAIRDEGSPFRMIPCPTCLHPNFRQPRVRSERVIVYEHYERAPIGLPFPTMKNNDPGGIEKVIAFLSSAEAVVTNTYHGAYWATLLGLRVVISESFSTRFRRTLWKYPALDCAAKLDEKIAAAPVDQNALERCVDLNLSFWKIVRTLFR